MKQAIKFNKTFINYLKMKIHIAIQKYINKDQDVNL